MPTYSIIILLAIVVFVVALSVISNKVSGGGRSSDMVRIVRCDLVPFAGSPMGGWSITDMTGGRSISAAGSLQFVIGTPPMQNLPSEVEIKFLFIGSDLLIKEATATLNIEPKGIIGTGSVYAPAGMRRNEFTGKAWVIRAYYASGQFWANTKAEQDEAKHAKYMQRQLAKIKRQHS